MARGLRLRAWSSASLALTVVIVATETIGAQIAFDVASVKESAVADGGAMRLMPGGGIRVQHLPARSLITIAYQLQPYQLVDAPGWAGERFYDIEAKPAGVASREQTFAMLQALLVERFRFAFHRERRQLDGFALVRVRADRLGPGLRPSSVDCEKTFTSTPRCRTGGITADTMTAVGTPIWSLLQALIAKAGAPVTDETGLAGPFDFELRWSNDVAPTDDRLSIFTALQDQLGLKLERRPIMAEVVIVDRLERPTPD